MSEQLYRSVKASERLPDEYGAVNWQDAETNLPISAGGAYHAINSGAKDKVQWLEPIPSLNAGSLEEFSSFMDNSRDAFVKEVNDQEWNTKLRTTAEDLLNCFDQMRATILAGAAYVKGGEEKAQSVYNTIKPVSNDKLLAEYSKLRPANEDRDKDYSPLQDLFMNEIAAHLKLYTNPEVFEKAWTASLFPERLTKACLRATEQYIDSRPSLDIDKVVEQLREANPYARGMSNTWRGWDQSCDKLKELLNQSK